MVPARGGTPGSLVRKKVKRNQPDSVGDQGEARILGAVSRPATVNWRPVQVILQLSTRWRGSPGDDSLPHSKALLTPGFHLQPSRLPSQAELTF